MRCPYCKHRGDKVIDTTRTVDLGTVRRRRECKNCRHRWTTEERIVTTALAAERRSQATRLGKRETVSS